MTSHHPSGSDSKTLLWEEGPIDLCNEHFRLYHREVSDREVARVGPRTPYGLLVRFGLELPSRVRDDLTDELWSWCSPPEDDPWFGIDLWHNLSELALEDNPYPGPIRWELVPGTEASSGFVDEITALFLKWERHLNAELSGSSQDVVSQREQRRAFLRDYVTLMALQERRPRQTIGRLARFVRLQVGEDPSARLELQLTTVAGGGIHVRLGRIDDFNFSDAWACLPFDRFIVTKLRPRASKPWTRGEVRALLRTVDMALASSVLGAEWTAEVEGPSLRVGLRSGFSHPFSVD